MREVYGDGRGVLVIPSPDSLAIYLAQDPDAAGCSYAAPLVVAYESSVETRVGNPERAGAKVGQSVRLPWVRTEDIDGDGHTDLVSRLEREVHFHLAPGGILSPIPSWTLDLAALEAELPKLDGIQFSDLLTHAGRGVDWRVADLDGVAPSDLVLRVGGSLRVYLGGAARGPVGRATQVLRSSGNVLFFFLRDVDGDGREDLQLLRSEGLSLARILRWLIFPGTLEFDLYTYENVATGKSVATDDTGADERIVFTKRPTRRQGVDLAIPRLASFEGRSDEIEAQMESDFAVPARRFRLGPGAADVVDLIDGRLVVHIDPPLAGVPELPREGGAAMAWIEALILDDLDRQGDGGRRKIDLSDPATFRVAEGALLREACAGRPPTLVRPLSDAPQGDDERTPQLLSRDLDGDGLEDLIVVRRSEQGYGLEFLVWR